MGFGVRPCRRQRARTEASSVISSLAVYSRPSCSIRLNRPIRPATMAIGAGLRHLRSHRLIESTEAMRDLLDGSHFVPSCRCDVRICERLSGNCSQHHDRCRQDEFSLHVFVSFPFYISWQDMRMKAVNAILVQTLVHKREIKKSPRRRVVKLCRSSALRIILVGR